MLLKEKRNAIIFGLEFNQKSINPALEINRV
jgi:hypothetical protein